MKRHRKLTAFIVAVLFIVFMIPVSAQDAVQTANLALKAKSAILMEASTGQILYENNAKEKMAPASVTKIMTMLLVMEAIDAGKISETDTVTCSQHAHSMGGTQIWLEVGERMTVDDLLKATAVNSANDATVALAEAVAGSEDAFVELMNKRAKELGMNDTTFKNATGLDADGHVTTAYDIALMSKELLKHKKIFKYTTIWMDTLRNGETSLVNTNKLVRFYEGATGLKTGTTDSAGSCLSATATRNNLSLISVVMGCATSDDRFSSARTMLDYGFSNWAVFTPQKTGEFPDRIRVLKGTKQYVALSYDSLVPSLIPKGREKDVTYKVNIPSDLMAPIENGQVAGTISLYLDGKQFTEFPVKVMESVGRITFSSALVQLLKAVIGMRQ